MTDPKVPGKAIPALPKIKRQSNKGGLRNVDSNSRDAKEVTLTIERSSLDLTYNSPWRPKAIQMVVNKELDSQYREKKAAMKEEGRPARELQDHFAFILVKDPSVMTKIAQEGVKTKAIAFNALGNSKLGIYVCKHADVQLKLAESWRVNRCHLIVCKVMYGKCKLVTAQSQAGAEMEPTPNFDCHVSQEKANPNDPYSLQIMKSMVYMYEYNEDCETIDRPKHCVPYAFVVYEKSNERKTSSDSKAPQWTTKTKSQTSSRPTSGGNEARRKSNREAFEKRVAGLYPAPQFPQLYIPPVENQMMGQQGLVSLPVRSPVYSVYQTRQDPRVRIASQDSDDSARMKPEEEQNITPYSPGGIHVENGEERIPTPERELEDSIIKASFRKDAQSAEPSETIEEKEEVDLSMLNVNSDQLEAVVKHLEAVLRKKQEELLMRERMAHDNHNHESLPDNEQVSQIQDVDERITLQRPNTKDSYIVNEMGDIDERVRTSSLIQNNSWNRNFSSVFGFDPRSIPFPKPKVELPIHEESTKHSTDIIQEVPMDIDSDSESNPIKSTLQTNTNELSPKGKKLGRKVSLSDYKARRKQVSPIRSKVNEVIAKNKNTSNINDQSLLSLPPHVVVSSYSQYLTEEQAMSFQQSYPHDRSRSADNVHLRTPDVSTSQQISNTMHNPQSSGYSPRASSSQITSSFLKSPNASLSPVSASSTHYGFFQRSPTGNSPGASSNQPIGSILQKVNVDISNIKSILQSIAASPTSTPASSPEKNIWSSAHEDVPWLQLKEVKQQLSYEEEQAGLRYDAYNLKTAKTEIPLEDDDDADYTSLISKIKNLQHEIDQIKKDKKSRNAEWPSPLKDAKELVDKKLENNKHEIPSVSRGADLLQDLEYFQEEKEQHDEPEKTSDDVKDLNVSDVKIPGLGFFDESPEKTISATNEKLKPDVEIIDLCDDDINAQHSKQREDAELVEISDNPDSDDNCLVICDHPAEEDHESSKLGSDSFSKDPLSNVDETAKCSDKKGLQVEEHNFQVPLDMSSPIKHPGNSVVDRNSDTDKDIGYISCEGSYSSEIEISPKKPKIFPLNPPNRDSKEENGRTSSNMLDIKPEENSTVIQIKETAKLSTTNPMDTLKNTNSTSIARSDETKKKAQRAKMKAYILKKNRGMIGYTKKRKRKKKATDMDDFVSTTSSDLLDISESLSVDRFSGAMSSNTRMSSPMEFIPKLNTLFNDLGVKHWTDGLKIKELQPVVYLRRCDDPKSATDQPLTRKRLETQTSENLPDVDSRFPQHKDDRVKEWIEGTRKKIKLTLKDPQNKEEVNAQSILVLPSAEKNVPTPQSIPVLPSAEKNVPTPITVKPVQERICVPNSNELNEIKTEQPERFSQIKTESSSTSGTSMANTIVKNEQKATQGQHRDPSPITVICSKPSVLPQMKMPSPTVTSTQSQSQFKPLNVVSSSQPASSRQDLLIPRIVKLSASSPVSQLPLTTIKSETVIQQSTANSMSETFTSPSQPPPHQNVNLLTKSYFSKLTSQTGSSWPHHIVNPISAVQQRLPVPLPAAGIHQSLTSFRAPYLPSAGHITLTTTAIPQVQPLVINTQSTVNNVQSLVNTRVSTILVIPQNVQVRTVDPRNFVQVSTTYGTNLNYPPPYTHTSASPHPFPGQRFQSPITQSLYQGVYHPTQSSTQNLQPSVQRPPYSNQPHLQHLHPGTFQHNHPVIPPSPEQGMPGHLILQGVQPPPPQVIPPQPVHQNLQPYTNLPNNQAPTASTSANFSTNNENAVIKKKSTDVMDWFAEKFVPKKHVKESGSNSYHDTYPDSDSRRSRRSRSRSPTDSYCESSQSPNLRKKRSDSFLVHGCQLQGAGRNELNIKTKDAHELSPRRKSKSPEGVYSPLGEERRDALDERNQSLETQTSTNTQRITTGSIVNWRERVQENTKETECSGSIFEETFGDDKSKPAFRNTFKLLTNNVCQPEREIADTPASPDNDNPNISFETPASPEQETPASPDHNVSEIPQISFDIIDVSESPDRPTDDEKSDLLDSSIDGLARKREFLRRQLDDLRSSSGSPRVSRNVELKSHDLIEISDEELEEGEIADEGMEGKGKGSRSTQSGRRVVAVRETDDTKDKVIGKYHKGLSVTVKSKGKSNHVEKKEVMDTCRDNGKEKERKSKRERSWSSDDSDHRTDKKCSDRPKDYHRVSRKDQNSRDHESRRIKSRGRSSSTDRHKKRRRSSSTSRHYKSRDRSFNSDRWYKSHGRSSSSGRRYRSRDRSSSSDRRYRSRGRSSSSDRKCRSRGRSSSSDRRYESHGPCSSKERRQDKYRKPSRYVYKVHDSDSSEDSSKTKMSGGKFRGSGGYGESHKEDEKSAEMNRIPSKKKHNTSTVANAWSEMLRQNPTNIEVIKGNKEKTEISKSNEDDLNVYKELKEYITLKNSQVSSTNLKGNRQNDVSEESKAAKGFVQVIRNTTSLETLKSWAIREFKFKSESEFDKIVPKITVDMDREIAQLSKCQRKSAKSKLRKEIEIAMETLRIENLNASQSSPVASAESIINDDKSVLEIRPFEPLNFTKLLIEKELEIVRDHLKRLWHSTQELIDDNPRARKSGASTLDNGIHLFSIRQDMQQIETDLVQRISTYGAHFGVPNRRVPNELLTFEEKNGHFSEESLVLVLSGYIPSKAFQKLSSLREKLENSKKEIAHAGSIQNKEQLQRLKVGKEEIHRARKAMMLSFTGPLSKKRIQKIKTKAKCYRNCIDYFKKELGEFDAESRLKYLMISLQDLDKHYNLLTQLQDEQEKQKHEEISQDIHLKRRRVMVDKFHENFRFVDNQLNSMYAKYQHTHPHVCVAITDVSKKIKEALTLIDAEKDSKNISVTTVAQLEQILKSCLSGYENVKQQIGRLV